MKVFYHADLDGMCSAAIVYQWAKVNNKNINCEDFIQMEYGSNDILDKTLFDINYLDYAFVLDFCFSVEEMEWLKLISDLVWIDHHKTSIEKIKPIEKNLNGIRDVSEAACVLTWKHCFPNENIPRAVLLLGDYDIWRFEYDDSLAYQYGMRAKGNISPTCDTWATLFSSVGDTYLADIIIEDGKSILNYLKQSNKEYIETYSFEGELDGYSAIICNIGRASSQIFDSIYDPEKYDLMIAFVMTSKKTWRVSLYSTKENIDCSEIAKRRGGGGHKGAAGFVSTDSLFPSITLQKN